MAFKPLLAETITDFAALRYPLVASPKLDGCFTAGTKIWTDVDPLKIGDIVDKHLEVNAASYNEKTKKIEFKPIALIHWLEEVKAQ